MSHFTDSEANRKRLQQALIDAGYDCGLSGADGVLGNDTAAALVHYKAAHSMEPTPTIDNALLHSLHLIDYVTDAGSTPNVLFGLILSIITKGAVPMNLPDIAGWLNSSVILGFLRNLLISAGGVLTTSGIFTGAQWEQIVGVIIMIISAILSALANKKAADAKAVAQAVMDHPDLTVVPTPSGTAKVIVK